MTNYKDSLEINLLLIYKQNNQQPNKDNKNANKSYNKAKRKFLSTKSMPKNLNKSPGTEWMYI